MEAARVTVFAGHYGSGKTTLAVNYALSLRDRHERVTLCDLDIVNPYFRTADARELLEAREIRLISSGFANSNVDAPAMPPQASAIFDDLNIHAVIDLGGDDRGSLALGRYAKRIRSENNYAMLLVFNPFRPLTRTPEALDEVRREIEAASGVEFTGIVHNANLGAETTLEHVAQSFSTTQKAAKHMGLPVAFAAVRRALLSIQPGVDFEKRCPDITIFPIDLLEKTIWKV